MWRVRARSLWYSPGQLKLPTAVTPVLYSDAAMRPHPPANDPAKLDQARFEKIAADARRHADQRALGYREQALKLYPWICGRCRREFTRVNLAELTVHHRNHNHDDNPAGGSNWELLCLFCHDNEHSRELEHQRAGASTGLPQTRPVATGNPFSGLKDLLAGKK